MSNMSYCRFENTSKGLEDCQEAMSDTKFDENELSSDIERDSYYRLVKLCVEIACDFGNCEQK